jgi:hypothetical protein
MSATPLYEEEKAAHMAELNTKVHERVLVDSTKYHIAIIMKESDIVTNHGYTAAQLLRHRQLVCMAAENKCIREHTVYKEYLASSIGQHLENARWKFYRNSDDKDLWSNETQRPLPGKSAMMVLLQSGLGFMILLSLLVGVVLML